MAEDKLTEIIELATTQIIGDKEFLTEDEMRRVVWLVAQILSKENNEGIETDLSDIKE